MLTATAVPPVFREATLDDVDALITIGLRFRSDSVYAARLTENPTQMGALARRLIESPEGLVLVLERDGAVVGTIGLLLFPHHFSGELTVAELFFWVNPDQRGHGVRLLRRAETWARARGASTMQMIAPTPEVGRLYARMGYAELEVAYAKELGPCR